MAKKVVIYVVALFLSHLANGQEGSIMTNLKSNLKRADEYYNSFSYQPAIELYTFILKKSPDNHPVKLRLAECYRKLNDPINAAKWYATVVNKDSVIAPIYLLYYAQALNANGQYEEAKRWYSKYQEQIKTDNRALNRIWGINNLTDFYRDSAVYTVQKLSVNTQASDFSPSFYKDGLVFVSAIGKELFIRHVYSWDQSALLDVYFSHIQPDGDLSSPQKFNGEVNSRYHEGPAVFYSQDRKMIFTRNNLQEDGKPKSSRDGVSRIGLYSAEQTKNGKGWTGITALPFNSEAYSVGHPAITRDGLTLYFVSDMPGGRGGMDLYYSKLEGATWSKPVNMGPQINTEGNEMFPFIHADSVLYFSSDGYGGLGGLDVYKTNLRGNDALIVTNPGFPINTNADDFAFILDQSGQAGYFSSNRKGGKGSDDIYRFRMSSVIVNVIVAGLDNGKPLEGAQLTLISTRSRQEVSAESGKDPLTFPVRSGENYILKTVKAGYIAKTVIIPTQQHRPGDSLQLKVVLEKEKPATTDLVAYVYEAETGKALPGAQVYLLDEVTSDEQVLTTGSDGTFTFHASLTSSYAIIAEKGDKSGILSGIIAQNPVVAKNDTIKIPAYSSESSENKQLTQIALEEMITDGSNRTLASEAKVRLYKIESLKGKEITRQDGKIAFDLEPGNYILKINSGAYTSKTIVFSTRNMGETEKPQLNSKPNQGKPLSAPVTVFVFDADTHEGVAGAEVYLLNEMTSDERTFQTDQKGYFQFDAKFDCSYAVIAEKGEKSNVMTGLVAQNADVVEKDTIQIPLIGPAGSLPVTKEIHPATIISAIQEDENTRSTSAPAIVVRSSILDEQTGLPIPNAFVTLYDNTTGKEIAGRAHSGQTYFEVKAGSNYVLKSSKPGYRNKISIVTTKEWASGDTILVNVSIEKIGGRSELVKAQLYDPETGQVLANTKIHLVNEQTGADKHLTTDQQGYLTFEVDKASSYSMITESGEATGIVQNWSKQLLAGENNRIAVRSSVKKPHVNKSALIKVIAADSRTGDLVPVDAQLIDDKTKKGLKSIDSQKGYLFQAAANNPYVLKVSAKGYKSKARLVSAVEQAAGDTLLVKMLLEKSLPAAVPVEIEVIDEESGSPLAGAQLYLLNLNTSDEKRLLTDQAGRVRFTTGPEANYSIIVDKGDKSGVLMDMSVAEVSGKGPVRIPVSRMKTDTDKEQDLPIAAQKQLTKPAVSKKTSDNTTADEIRINKNRQFSSLPASTGAVNAAGTAPPSSTDAAGAEIFAIKNTSGSEQVFVKYKGRAFEFKQAENLKYLQTINSKMKWVIDQTGDEAEKDLAGLLERKLSDSNVPVKTFTRISSVYYSPDQIRLREDAREEVNKLIYLLRMIPSLKVEVRSHTDSHESHAYNQHLSVRRAKEAVAYLVGRGVIQNRIKMKCFGENQLVNDCRDNVPCPKKKHQQNRRTEFLIWY